MMWIAEGRTCSEKFVNFSYSSICYIQKCSIEERSLVMHPRFSVVSNILMKNYLKIF
jgi:hypothetical protein